MPTFSLLYVNRSLIGTHTFSRSLELPLYRVERTHPGRRNRTFESADRYMASATHTSLNLPEAPPAALAEPDVRGVSPGCPLGIESASSRFRKAVRRMPGKQSINRGTQRRVSCGSSNNVRQMKSRLIQRSALMPVSFATFSHFVSSALI